MGRRTFETCSHAVVVPGQGVREGEETEAHRRKGDQKGETHPTQPGTPDRSLSYSSSRLLVLCVWLPLRSIISLSRLSVVMRSTLTVLVSWTLLMSLSTCLSRD